MTSDELLSRARERCSHHLPGRGVCRRCIVEAMEEMLVEENPGLAPGDAVELVAELFAREGEPVQ